MAKPIILTLDDDADVLRAIERDLRAEYGGMYRIVRADSGSAALELLAGLKRRGETPALFLVDQRMPQMTGVEFLEKAIALYPEARRVLLTAYADTEAAIHAINQVQVDHYLLKPWDPPEEKLYPVLDDLLADWQAAYQPPFDGIRVVGHQWLPDSHRVKDFLAGNHVPYAWLDVDTNPEATQLLAVTEGPAPELPALFFTDGTHLANPSNRAIADRIGIKTIAEQPLYDLLIVGAGPAGLAAAVYGASEGLRTVLLEKEGTGGQAGTSARIENYLGFPKGLSGADLARRAVTQARRFGAEILAAREVCGIEVEDPYRRIRLEAGDEIACHVVILATGIETRQLQVPGAEALTGTGLFYGAAVTEAANFRGQPVFVVGGGNSAGQGAVFLSRFASRVTMLVRGSSLQVGMSQYLIDQIEATDNIEVLPESVVEALEGEGRLEAALIRPRGGEPRRMPGAAMFVFIGAMPRTELVGDLVERDRAGFVLTGADLMKDGKPPKGWPLKRDPFLLETSVPGIFAAGDVRHGSIKRVAAAIGEGSACVQFAHQYLKTV